jgi:two-component system sensor histidine kinase PhoQ
LKAGIQTRLLLITTVVLGTFLFLAGVVLDRSFKASVLGGAEEQLKLVIYSLMGSLEKEGVALQFGAALPEPRLHQPESGLYARVAGRSDGAGWQSPSVITTAVRFPHTSALIAGDFDFSEYTGDDEVARFVLNYAVIWEDESVLDFAVATDQRPFRETIGDFRQSLYIGLGAVTVFFVLAQLFAVRWGLRPLRTMAGEVRELEEGRRERLSDTHPVELEGLAENLGRFVAHEERSRTRYRKAMEDLAHSLKTPLAVMRNELSSRSITNSTDSSGDDLVAEQLDRMETTVTHQLNRAAVSGPVVVGRAVPVGALVERLLRALNTAYRDRQIEVEQLVPADLSVRGDERDLLEMLGNLLENAFKYTRTRISISADREGSEREGVMRLLIEDDGPGIEDSMRERVLNRGTRADEIQSGQGIGLAMVNELVGVYKGKLSIGVSRWGGAAIHLQLPLSASMVR